MRIPEIQSRLRSLAETGKDFAGYVIVASSELHKLADQLSRRKATKGPVTSDPMSFGKRTKIRELYSKDLSQLAISRKLNISSGRVSETLRGERV